MTVTILIAETVVYYGITIAYYLWKYRTFWGRRGQGSDVKGIECELQWKRENFDYSFQLERGQRLGILGPSESGKSSLMKLMLGLGRVADYEGSLSVLGCDILARQPLDFRQVGFCLDYELLCEQETVLAHIDVAGECLRIPRDIRLRRLFYLVKIFELESHLAKPIATLSEGTKRKVTLVIAMLRAPRLLVFDEPTKGVDLVVGKHLMLAILYLVEKLQQTLIFTTKRKNDLLEISDYCLTLGTRSESLASDSSVSYEPETKLNAVEIQAPHRRIHLNTPKVGHFLLSQINDQST